MSKLNHVQCKTEYSNIYKYVFFINIILYYCNVYLRTHVTKFNSVLK